LSDGKKLHVERCGFVCNIPLEINMEKPVVAS